MDARRRRGGGQAALELVALVPALLALALLAWQLTAAAHAWLIAGGAARAAARAAVVGAPAGPAARAALPPAYGRGARVRMERGSGGAVAVWVEVPVPAVLPGLPPLGTVAAAAAVAGGGG